MFSSARATHVAAGEGQQRVVLQRRVAAYLVVGGQTPGATQRCLKPGCSESIENSRRTGSYGFSVQLVSDLKQACLEDDHGDVLDSVLCAIQTAWAFGERDRGWGIPAGVEHEGWIVDPALVRHPSEEQRSWVAVLADTPLPRAQKGSFNSSKTRVQPVFRSLLEQDGTGRLWLPVLLRLASSNRPTADELAERVTVLEPTTLRNRKVTMPDGSIELIEGCFERSFPPPALLLAWCIAHPAALTRKRRPVSQDLARQGRSLRRDLLGPDLKACQLAQQAASALIERVGPERSRSAWWAFEGFTSADCVLETPELLLIIEGKRFEGVSDAGSWISGRNQISRNLEVVSVCAERSGKDFAVLLIGPDGCSPPADAILRAGWPHLSEAKQDRLLSRFLGATTWRRVCEIADLNYNRLPVTTSDVQTMTMGPA